MWNISKRLSIFDAVAMEAGGMIFLKRIIFQVNQYKKAGGLQL
jgi:hypothetical protein